MASGCELGGGVGFGEPGAGGPVVERTLEVKTAAARHFDLRFDDQAAVDDGVSIAAGELRVRIAVEKAGGGDALAFVDEGAHPHHERVAELGSELAIGMQARRVDGIAGARVASWPSSR